MSNVETSGGTAEPAPQASRRDRGLFISYRRGETSGQARANNEQLANLFGEYRVFMDDDSIAPGTDFVSRIDEALNASGLVLALIGHDWIERAGAHDLVNNPEDFIRLELATALRTGVPTIPVLIERAPMPEASRLPEELRGFTRINALELENARWDFDVNRLVSTVDRYLDRAVTATPSAASTGTAAASSAGSPARPRRRRLVAIVVALVVVAAAIAVPMLMKSHPPANPPVSAASAVAPVPSDQLVLALARTPVAAKEVPAGSTAGTPHLAAIHYTNLDADVFLPVSGPSPTISVDYEVYDTTGDASAERASSVPLTSGMKQTSSFSAPGVADPTVCAHGRDAALDVYASGCVTQSDRVLIFVQATSFANDLASDNAYVASLDADLVSHLGRVAAATSHQALATPPGSLTPSALYEQLQASSFETQLLPSVLASPSTTLQSLGGGITGMVAPDVVLTTFSGPDAFDEIDYFVFTSEAGAARLYSDGLTPNGTRSTGTIDSSGGSATTRCETFTTTSGSTTNYISCFALDGDVLVESRVATRSSLSAQNDVLAVVLDRMGVFHVGEAVTR